MRFDAFVGGTYALDSVIADCQRCINLYPEIIESGSGRSRARFHRTPGRLLFATMGDGPVRKLIEINGRCFAVAGGGLYEIYSDGSVTARGVVSAAGVAAIVASPIQLMISAGGHLYCYTLATNVLTPIPAPDAEWVAYCDTYFLAIEPGTQRLYVSGVLDGTAWNLADVTTAEAAADNVTQLAVDHREVWVFGKRTIRPYYNSGAAAFPFDPIPGSLIETGMIGHTVARADNALFWVSQDERGNGMVQRNNGYTPMRVSNHSVEEDLQSLDLTDAEAFTYQEQGHIFYQICVPGAERSWVYDISTGLWHERAYWDAVNAVFEADRAVCHCFAFGKHLVGNGKGREVYEQSVSYYDDDGDILRWLRRAPHMANENYRVTYNSLEILMECGVGLLSGADPQLHLRFSNDGARNWSSVLTATSFGKVGETTKRVRFNRLGTARDRVFEVSGTDAVPVTIVDALLELTPGVS